MTEHTLKCWPEYYAPVERGEKTLELRLNDRGFQVGDVLLLREWEPMEHAYTGRECRCRVTHIVSGGEWLSPGYIAMSIAPIWNAVDPKPADWEKEYSMVLPGKSLEAMRYLATWALAQPPVLPFGVIGAADHLFCLAAAARVAGDVDNVTTE